MFLQKWSIRASFPSALKEKAAKGCEWFNKYFSILTLNTLQYIIKTLRMAVHNLVIHKN